MQPSNINMLHSSHKTLQASARYFVKFPLSIPLLLQFFSFTNSSCCFLKSPIIDCKNNNTLEVMAFKKEVYSSCKLQLWSTNTVWYFFNLSFLATILAKNYLKCPGQKNSFLPASLFLTLFLVFISVCAICGRDSSPRTRPKTIWPFTNRNWTGNKGSGFSRYLFVITLCRLIYLCYKEELLVNLIL